MTMLSFGQVAARALAGPREGRSRRSGAPVRRGSLEAGSFEDLFFAVPAKGETDRMLRAARALLDAGRKLRRAARAEARALSAAERPIAALTAGAVRVFEELLMLARITRGRVYPSYDRLATTTGLGRATVARALSLLEASGLMVRQRRFVRVEGEGVGPRYAQTSNAYRALLPDALLRFLPRALRPAPVPPCEQQRRADHAAAHAAMLEGLSARDLARATVGGPLGRMLARLGAALDSRQCESHDEAEALTNSIDTENSGVGLVGQRMLA